MDTALGDLQEGQWVWMRPVWPYREIGAEEVIGKASLAASRTPPTYSPGDVVVDGQRMTRLEYLHQFHHEVFDAFAMP